ncbi:MULTISPECIES: type III secretion system stator protein SctL [unclassified Pseudomonas]|uniref:type III secretion system stator protein SctL n=1 Tax=unclassified Pseudomonas TaxID=196821 RepID=UPI0011EC34EC|nr:MULTISPECIES: type III secretion system stator protein SctL [unclassified Pseudomonas]KAA0947056.1 HrpE/YscL family type III secretion apparatus protein [Pseudomonas sp. ANT_H4]KAA0953597.1 HrpE/YscL family type III secretion apparatus protein [Pseudomonas sp. ANT_H14]
MLCHRKIELHNGTQGLPQTLIPQETLIHCGQASRLLARAQTQVRELLQQAKQQRAELLEQALQAFRTNAEAQLSQLKIEHQKMCDGLEQSATSLVNQALRCLLEETPPAQRLAALLKQLLATQLPPVKATLLCHPLDREPVESWLSGHEELPWSLRIGDTPSAQTLVLKTEEGDFCVDWNSILETLMTPEKDG